jgi:hypothetical protein
VLTGSRVGSRVFESFINDKVMEFESSTVEMDFMRRVEYAIPKKRKEYEEIEKYYD